MSADGRGPGLPGDPSPLHTLTSPAGTVARVTPFGAALASLEVPDREGARGEIVLGLRRPEDYASENPNYFGVTVGRFAGRIADARFELDGTAHRLVRNLGRHQLHGGPSGFSHRLWRTEPFVEPGREGITFRLDSHDGDQGYPGRLSAEAAYWVDAAGRLGIRYRATTDAPTHVSLTNHAYFNLRGHGSVQGHRLELAADAWLVVGADGIPTGEVAPVAGTVMDFTRGKSLFANAGHYDHCFALEGWDDAVRWSPGAPRLRECARVEEPDSGRVMTVSTTLPGVQLYTPDFGPGTAGRSGGYVGRAAFCLETQFFPDAPNRPAFPSTRLEPGEVWEHETILAFGVL